MAELLRVRHLPAVFLADTFFVFDRNMDDFDMLNAPSAGNGVGGEEDPAAAFLAQQESEIAGIENDEGFSILDSGDVPSSLGDSNGGSPLPTGPDRTGPG